jgi:periplasmic protein TonB
MLALDLRGVSRVAARADGGRRGLALPASLGLHGAIATAAVMAGALRGVTPEARPTLIAPPLWPVPPASVRNDPPPPSTGHSVPRPGGPRLGDPRPITSRPAMQPSVDGSSSEAETNDEAAFDPESLVGSDTGGGDGERSGVGLPEDSRSGGGGGGGPVKVGGRIQAPAKRRHVNPVYPELARIARVQGAVVLECTIDTTGRVVNARVIRSVPLLDRAALEAVQQWEYEPTRLNGTPVAVILEVTVRFTLGH